MHPRSVCVPLVLALSFGCDSSDGSQTRDESGKGKADEIDTVTLSPVDVSFLIPPPPAGEHLSPEIRLDEGPFLDRSRFHTMFEAQGEFRNARGFFGDERDTFERFFVTGVRFDPCAPQAFHHGSDEASFDCRAELRLVVQPWIPTDTDCPVCGDGFDDAASHLIYRIDADIDEVVDDLIVIRDSCNERLQGSSTASSRVGPHPCLTGLNSTGEERKRAQDFLDAQIRPFLKKYATVDRLAGTAAMLGAKDEFDDLANAWEFRLFVNGPGGLSQIPALPHNPSDDSSVMIVAEDSTTFPPPTTEIQTADGASIGAQLHPDGSQRQVFAMQELSRATRHSNFEDQVFDGTIFEDPLFAHGLVSAYAAANPRLNHLPDAKTGMGGLDCATCHTQGSLTTILEEQGVIERLESQNPELFARIRANAFRGLQNPKDTMLPETRDYYLSMLERTTEQFVINFGYFEQHPSVSPRTVNETLDVVEYMSQILD